MSTPISSAVAAAPSAPPALSAPLLTNAQPAGARGSSALGQASFLRLMTAQIAAQDPFDPIDNKDMVAQMAQFSSVAGIAEINASMRAMLDTASAQAQLLSDIKAAMSSPATPFPPQAHGE